MKNWTVGVLGMDKSESVLLMWQCVTGKKKLENVDWQTTVKAKNHSDALDAAIEEYKLGDELMKKAG